MSRDLGQSPESPAEVWNRPALWRSSSGNGAPGSGAPGHPLSAHLARSASGDAQSPAPASRHAPTASFSSSLSHSPHNASSRSPPSPHEGARPGRGRMRAGTLPSRFSQPPPSVLHTPPSDPFGARWRLPNVSSPLARSDGLAPMFASVPDVAQPSATATGAAGAAAPFEPFARLPSRNRAQTDDVSASMEPDASGLVRTLDYLGLSDASPAEEPKNAPTPFTRERANTDASLLGRPGTHTSVAPGGPVRTPISAPTASYGPSAMQHRMTQLPIGGQDVFSGPTHRPRATSMGTLDTADPLRGVPASTTASAAAAAGAAAAVPRAHSPAVPPTRAPGHGRHRADTVAALSGPDGRQRTELELQRMAFGPHDSDTLPGLPNRARSLTVHANVTRDAERNLYISQLTTQASSRVLLRLFEPYGRIDDIVLFPQHNGALIQFCEAPHARAAHEAGTAFIGSYLVELLSEQRTPPRFSRGQAEWARGRVPPATPEPATPPTRLRHGGTSSIVPSSDKGGVPLPSEHVVTLAPEQQRAFGDTLHFRHGADPAVHTLESLEARTYHVSIPPVGDHGRPSRRFDNARFRELRKNVESGQMPQSQVDGIAMDHIEVIVELASNYIGNTVVQRFFEQCSEPVKTRLLERLAPHLATIGCHKNGTWAAQKIIDCARTDEQQTLITEHLQPYVPALLLDQFGNYVVQCVLPFGFPRATFILDAMVDRCWEIAQGRFGARSMRTVLENPGVPRVQLKRVAMAIILNCVPLATSANGSLLLTWLLDTSELDGVLGQLAPRFVPHLAQLCTHKLASVTVLRIVCQSVDPNAAMLLLRSIFDLPQAVVLEEILLDLVHGSQLVAKALQSPMLAPEAYTECTEKVAALLQHHDLVGAPAYRRLTEQVGLAVPDPLRAEPLAPKLDPSERPFLTVDGIPPMMPPSYGMMPPGTYVHPGVGMYLPFPTPFDIPTDAAPPSV